MAKEDNSKIIFVEREKYINKKNGVENFSYFIRVKVLKKELKATVKPDGITGYELLDAIFGDNNKAELRVVKDSMITENGENINFTNYFACAVDEETGVPVLCKLKPLNGSDKSLLDSICL